MPKKRPKKTARARPTVGATKRARAPRRTKEVTAPHHSTGAAVIAGASLSDRSKTPDRSIRRHNGRPATKTPDPAPGVDSIPRCELCGFSAPNHHAGCERHRDNEASLPAAASNDASQDPVGRHKSSSAELGRKQYGEPGYRDSRRSNYGASNLTVVWIDMLELKEFTVPQLARRTGVSKNYIKIYVRALRIAGYLSHNKGRWLNANPHNPTKYTIGPYRGKEAPQLAGGSGKTGKLGRGWRTIEGT